MQSHVLSTSAAEGRLGVLRSGLPQPPVLRKPVQAAHKHLNFLFDEPFIKNFKVHPASGQGKGCVGTPVS